VKPACEVILKVIVICIKTMGRNIAVPCYNMDIEKQISIDYSKIEI
jgi:hypothetical protein